MTDISIHLKNGAIFEFSVDGTLKEINIKLNKIRFMQFGPMIFNVEEIVYIKEMGD